MLAMKSQQDDLDSSIDRLTSINVENPPTKNSRHTAKL